MLKNTHGKYWIFNFVRFTLTSNMLLKNTHTFIHNCSGEIQKMAHYTFAFSSSIQLTGLIQIIFFIYTIGGVARVGQRTGSVAALLHHFAYSPRCSQILLHCLVLPYLWNCICKDWFWQNQRWESPSKLHRILAKIRLTFKNL